MLAGWLASIGLCISTMQDILSHCAQLEHERDTRLCHEIRHHLKKSRSIQDRRVGTGDLPGVHVDMFLNCFGLASPWKVDRGGPGGRGTGWGFWKSAKSNVEYRFVCYHITILDSCKSVKDSSPRLQVISNDKFMFLSDATNAAHNQRQIQRQRILG